MREAGEGSLDSSGPHTRSPLALGGFFAGLALVGARGRLPQLSQVLLGVLRRGRSCCGCCNLNGFLQVGDLPRGKGKGGKQGRFKTLTGPAQLVCLCRHCPNPSAWDKRPGPEEELGPAGWPPSRSPRSRSAASGPAAAPCAGWPGSPAPRCLTGPPRSPDTCGSWRGGGQHGRALTTDSQGKDSGRALGPGVGNPV